MMLITSDNIDIYKRHMDYGYVRDSYRVHFICACIEQSVEHPISIKVNGKLFTDILE